VAEVVTLFIERPAETRGCIHSPEATHRIIALFHSPMILLDAMIEVRATAMHDLHPERLADGPGIRVMAISCHPLWYLSGDV